MLYHITHGVPFNISAILTRGQMSFCLSFRKKEGTAHFQSYEKSFFFDDTVTMSIQVTATKNNWQYSETLTRL